MKIVASNNSFVYDELGSPGFELVNAEAVIATSGDEALAAVLEHSPDLLILDAELPGLDGYSVCERIKADPALRLVRVILVMHGSLSAPQLQRLAACGCDDVVVFRVPGEDLYHHAARLLGLPDPSLGEPVKLHVSVSAGAAAEISAHALQLSTASVDLLVPAPLAEGARVGLRLRRDGESAAVEADGVVVRNQVDSASNACIAAIRFVDLSVRSKARLADLALWEARTLPTGVRIAIRGAFDETTDFLNILERVGDSVIFDLSGVRLINSWGARRWILFLRSLPPTTSYCFVNASAVFIKHCNMVADIVGRGQVLSFAAPYECASCGLEHDRVLQVSSISPAVKLQPPEFRCGACSGVERFAEVPQRYFAFLRAVLT